MTTPPRAPSIPTPADHPPSCRTCHGDGWMPGPPRPDTGNPTCIPCTHHWSNDDPTPDQLIPWSDPRAAAAFATGYTQALADHDTTMHDHPTQPSNPMHAYP
jgi:hypothetical protein